MPPGPHAFLPTVEVRPFRLLLAVGIPVIDFSYWLVVAEFTLLCELAVGVPRCKWTVALVFSASVEGCQRRRVPIVGSLHDQHRVQIHHLLLFDLLSLVVILDLRRELAAVLIAFLRNDRRIG